MGEAMTGTPLQRVRKQLGYSADGVIRLLRQRADVRGVPVMTAASLKTKLSRWENGHEQVSQPYQRLFREIYGRTNDELGFPADEEDDDAAELRARLEMARTVDADTIVVFRRQIDDARRLDRKFGGVTLLDQLRGTIDQVESLLGYNTIGGKREQLAGALTEASTLAGWEALDRNAISQAWQHYERAKAAAREAMSPALLAHSMAEQAFILVDIGEAASAVDQVEHARQAAETPHRHCCARDSRRQPASAYPQPVSEARPSARSTPQTRCSRPSRSTLSCRSCSSAVPTSTDGVGTPSASSVSQKRLSSSPTCCRACPKRSYARVRDCSSISRTRSLRPETETPRSTMHDKRGVWRPGSNRIGSYGVWMG